MFKKILIAACLSLFALQASADEASLKKKFEAAYPKIKIESIVKTPFAGLYEVFFSGQIIYTDEEMSFLIAEGHLVDPKTKRDITGDRLEELNKVDFASLPLDKAIKVVKGNGKRKLVVFSDVDCPYCKRLERNELTNLTDVTVYTFLYPIDQLHPDAKNKSKSIWCAKDRVAAWNNWILHDKLPGSASSCETPIELVGDLARRYGVVSTPTLVFEDGKRLLGAYPHKEIETRLQAASAKK